MDKNFKKLLFLSIFSILGFQFLGCSAHQTAISDSQSPNKTTSNASTVNNINTVVNISKKNDPELEKNKQLWGEKNITNYNLTASLFKSGTYRWAEPVLIKVRNGQTISMESLDEKFKGNPIKEIEEAIEGYKEVNTIEKMFDHIQKGLDEEAEVSVKYDKTFGYPKEWVVNFNPTMTDSGQKMIIRKFKVIK